MLSLQKLCTQQVKTLYKHAYKPAISKLTAINIINDNIDYNYLKIQNNELKLAYIPALVNNSIKIKTQSIKMYNDDNYLVYQKGIDEDKEKEKTHINEYNVMYYSSKLFKDKLNISDDIIDKLTTINSNNDVIDLSKYEIMDESIFDTDYLHIVEPIKKFDDVYNKIFHKIIKLEKNRIDIDINKPIKIYYNPNETNIIGIPIYYYEKEQQYNIVNGLTGKYYKYNDTYGLLPELAVGTLAFTTLMTIGYLI
jgi:hypothetical protein